MENNLSIIDGLGSALDDQRAAAEAAQFTENLSMARYKQGAVRYLDVVVAQTASLQTQRNVLDLQTQQLAASVALIKALGGGWDTQELSAK
ncbi:Toluene efflux pump outer membrane protein TtgF precursor [compost metagenome]